MIRRKVILGILFIIMLILLWVFYHKALMYNPIGDIEKIEKVSEDKAAKEAPSFTPGWGKEIERKSLFSKTRTSVTREEFIAGAEVSNAEIIEEKPLLTLKGIIQNEQGEYIALIEKGTEKAMPLRKGDRIDNVLVVDIKERTVDLLWKQEKIKLSIEKIKTLAR